VLKPITFLTDYILEKVPSEPARRRAKIYRALADVTPIRSEQKRLRALANECDLLDAEHDQIVFEFHRRAKRGRGRSNGGQN
jgi:hypothetical protein